MSETIVPNNESKLCPTFTQAHEITVERGAEPLRVNLLTSLREILDGEEAPEQIKTEVREQIGVLQDLDQRSLLELSRESLNQLATKEPGVYQAEVDLRVQEARLDELLPNGEAGRFSAMVRQVVTVVESEWQSLSGAKTAIRSTAVIGEALGRVAEMPAFASVPDSAFGLVLGIQMAMHKKQKLVQTK